MTDTPFVSTDWLAAHLQDPALKLVDASWFLPGTPRDPEQEFLSAHIPGAVFFDLDLIAEPNTDLPHMAASAKAFAEAVGLLGISQTDTVIVYDSQGLFSAARVWWNFRIMGADKTFVLEGGLPRWLAEDRPTEAGPAAAIPAVFSPSPIAAQIVGVEVVRRALGDPQQQVVDVRPADRFAGIAPEPRPGLRSGHMPGAFNMPFSELVGESGLEAPDILDQRMRAKGIDPQKPIIASCGSGVTAPIMPLALAAMGINSLRVYDGSWAEWGRPGELPVVTDA